MKNRAIPEINMYRCIENAVPDPLVGIRIIRVTGDDAMGLYIAEPDPENRITAHFHTHGNEIYCILRVNGRIHTGQPGNRETVTRDTPVDLAGGDSFTVPEGMVHSLENTGRGPLLFHVCTPSSHTGKDRIIVG
jgi:mannose-6-phosphate isomerase-like protein (cupin superfamily)